jgi:hypothetical protein
MATLRARLGLRLDRVIFFFTLMDFFLAPEG